MDPDQLRKIVINARDTITNAPSTPIQSITPSNLLSTTQSLFPTTLISSPNPKIDQVCSIDPSGGVMTLNRSLNFLDSQTSFNIIFGDDLPCPVLLPTRRDSALLRTQNIFIRM